MKKQDFNTRFLEFTAGENILPANARVLAAVSGGLDSVVMCHLLAANKIKFGIAHMNFRLRGEDSETDQVFVNALAKKYKVDFYAANVNTVGYAKEKKISIEMAARELRYNWFEEIRKENDYTSIATAHHLNDQTETILLNLVKGTGLRGLRGMLPQNNFIIRPLLFATRSEIKAYADHHKINFRTDISNNDIAFQRNFIRHHVIPELKKVNPSLETTFARQAHFIRQYELFISKQINALKEEMQLTGKEGGRIPIPALKAIDFPDLLLFELLRDYGFNYEQVQLVWQAVKGTPGKTFKSDSYMLVKDRDDLVITPLPQQKGESLLIHSLDEKVGFNNLLIGFELIKPAEIIDLKNPDFAFIDYDKISLPITIRHWEQGDYFYPFGMKGRKKVSDFLIDQKIPLNLKPDVTVFSSKNRILWLAGMRVDNRFAVTENTKSVLKITIKKRR